MFARILENVIIGALFFVEKLTGVHFFTMLGETDNYLVTVDIDTRIDAEG